MKRPARTDINPRTRDFIASILAIIVSDNMGGTNLPTDTRPVNIEPHYVYNSSLSISYDLISDELVQQRERQKRILVDPFFVLHKGLELQSPFYRDLMLANHFDSEARMGLRNHSRARKLYLQIIRRLSDGWYNLNEREVQFSQFIVGLALEKVGEVDINTRGHVSRPSLGTSERAKAKRQRAIRAEYRKLEKAIATAGLEPKI